MGLQLVVSLPLRANFIVYGMLPRSLWSIWSTIFGREATSCWTCSNGLLIRAEWACPKYPAGNIFDTLLRRSACQSPLARPWRQTQRQFTTAKRCLNRTIITSFPRPDPTIAAGAWLRSSCREGRLEILLEIVKIFQPNRQSNQTVGDIMRGSICRIITGMRHGRRLFDQRFDCPQAHG